MVFRPILKERLWGGHNLARIHGKRPLAGMPIGESWEIADRCHEVSIIANGELAGRSLRWLLEQHYHEVLGNASSPDGRFPLLIKIIDAERPLSLQVHPSERCAAQLGGAAKTEMWYVAEARTGAEIFAGLRQGTTRADFEARMKSGNLIDCIHRIPITTGSAMLVPGGRVHAIGGQAIIFEIQQNSDTTYRLFDWNRVDATGRSRELHIESALRCIDFSDHEPSLLPRPSAASAGLLIDAGVFRVETVAFSGTHEVSTGSAFVIVGGLDGRFEVHTHSHALRANAGTFCLLPAALAAVRLTCQEPARVLLIRPALQ